MQRIFSLVCFCGLLWSANAQTPGKRPTVERGLASWYGVPYNGRLGSNGQTYDEHQLTAAHRTLPFGTEVRVRRLDRNRSVVVRITDRGPFVESRIIDVSEAAAEILGMTRRGVVPVAVEIVPTPPVEPGSTFTVDLRKHRPEAETVLIARRPQVLDSIGDSE